MIMEQEIYTPFMDAYRAQERAAKVAWLKRLARDLAMLACGIFIGVIIALIK